MRLTGDGPETWSGGGAGPTGERALWRAQSDSIVGSLVEGWLEPGAAVLKTDLYDEAVGGGLVAVLAARFERVVGVDSDPAIVAEAVSAVPEVEAIVADVRDLPLQAGSVDAVLSNSTLDHLASRSDVLAALAELRRVLRPAGALLITMDNRGNPLIALRNALPERLQRRARGGFAYDAGWTCGPRGLRRLLEDAGFRVERRSAVLHAPRFAIARMGGGKRQAELRLRRILGWERLARWPTRYLSGHFVAALARAPQ